MKSPTTSNELCRLTIRIDSDRDIEVFYYSSDDAHSGDAHSDVQDEFIIVRSRLVQIQRACYETCALSLITL